MAERYIRMIRNTSVKVAEIKRVNRAWRIFQLHHADLIKRAHVRAAYVAGRRRGIIEAMMARVNKAVIAQEIRESLESESMREKKGILLTEGLEEAWRRNARDAGQKRKHLKISVEGGKRFITRKDGQAWLLPQEIEEELTWRREK